jgi:hypothetical protein
MTCEGGLSAVEVGVRLARDGANRLPAPPRQTWLSALLAVSGQPMVLLLLACTLLYAFPRTAVLGAILLTGYLGGAVATHLRVGSPVASHLLFGVYVGLMAWGGVFLREPRLAALIPLRRPAADGERR